MQTENMMPGAAYAQATDVGDAHVPGISWGRYWPGQPRRRLR